MMGFNAWFFGRIDLQDRKVRESNKALEFVVHPSSMDHSILTHVNYYGYYSSPQGFDFDVQNPNRQQVNDNNV
jgi:alpha-mannosidase/lysosomal alpha-mannosidase